VFSGEIPTLFRPGSRKADATGVVILVRKRERKKKETKDKEATAAQTLSDSKTPLRRVLMNVLDSEQMRVAIVGSNGL
jgi:hypothetical protein